MSTDNLTPGMPGKQQQGWSTVEGVQAQNLAPGNRGWKENDFETTRHRPATGIHLNDCCHGWPVLCFGRFGRRNRLLFNQNSWSAPGRGARVFGPGQELEVKWHYLSTSQAVVRYNVQGDPLADPVDSVMEHVRNGLVQGKMPVEKSEYDEVVAGWVPFEGPYNPNFEKHSFIFGTYFVFSLRIDKKTVPAKAVAEQLDIAVQEKLAETDREFLSSAERAELKAMVMDQLLQKVPFVPSIYEIVWDYEEKTVMFFSTQKAANDLFETLFLKSFGFKIHQLFPYTLAARDNASLIDFVSDTTPIAIGRSA